MLNALYNFFIGLFSGDSLHFFFEEIEFTMGSSHTSIYLDQYLAFLCSIISLIFIVVLCCLFVYKIIKLIGGLIR